MTPEEKQEIINAVISQLLSSGCDITGLDAAQSLDGISTFPAVLTTTNNGVTTKALVSVPISLLTQSIQDVITSANTAATSARSAAAGWAAAAVKMGSDIVVIEGDISNLQDADKSLTTLTAYAECSTAANVSAKAVTVPYFALPTSGGCLHIKMEHANTAVSGVTLNINATGAKDLFYNGSAVSATNTWRANEVLQIYYDGTNYQATNAQGGGGSAEPSYVVPTWSGYVGASNATTIGNVNLNNLTHYSNASGSVSVQISSTSYLWFVVNREVRIESFGIEVPVQYIGMDNDLYYYKTYEQILPSTIGVELIATDASQGDDSGGGDTPTPTPTAQKPTIVTPPQSANYNEGATPNALTVVASVSDGGTLSFQWYKDNSPFGSADSGTAVSNGVQSSITPTSVTATYYCVITNTKSGANSNTNQTTSVTVTFNEESGSEETDLSDFVEGYWNASGQKVEDSNYLSSPLIDVSTDKNFVVFNDISKTGKTTSPTHVLSLWTGENTCRSAWEDSDKGKAGSAASGDTYMRFVFPNDATRADYCFIKIGNNYPFKGSKIKDGFLSKIYAFGKKMSNKGVTKGSDVNIVTNNSISLTGDRAFTFIAGPFDLQSGHTYTFETGRTSNGTPELDVITFVDDNNKLVDFQYKKVSSFPNDSVTVIPSGATKFYLTCVFKNMHNCYLKDNGVYVWYGANIEI